VLWSIIADILIRPVSQLVFRQFVEQHFPVIRKVGSRGEPGDHIVPVLRGIWIMKQILQLVASRQLHQDVIGIHGSHFPFIFLLGRHPQILAVVEDLGIGHVEDLVLSSLNSKKILRVAQMGLEIG